MLCYKKRNTKLKFSSLLALLSLSIIGCSSPKSTPVITATAAGQTSIGSGTSINPAAAPSNAQSRALSSTSIGLSWTDNATDEDGFHVYRSFNGNSNFNLIATLAPNTTRFYDTQLFPNTTYYYKVTAYKAALGDTPAVATSSTTFSGDWKSIAGSASAGGLSNTANANSSWPSVATDAAGRMMVVWQENINGLDQIYGLFFDPNQVDSSSRPLGWKPIIINAQNITSTDDATSTTTATKILSVTYGTLQLSTSGAGLSQAAGNAQEPTVAYNATNDEFDIFWQEKRNGLYGIYGRRVKIRGFNVLAGTGNYYAQMSDSSIQVNKNSVSIATLTVNEFADDGYTTVASTWRLSTAVAGATAVHPQAMITSTSSDAWVVWQNFNSAASANWQVMGSRSTLAACAAYPNANLNPAAPAPVVGAMDTAALSNAGTGISASVTATEHAMYPTVTIANATGNNNVYVAWQQWNSTASTKNWDIKLKGCANLCTVNANSFAAVTNAVVNLGDSQHPKMASDANGLPYLAWDDNTYGNNHGIYVLQGTVSTTPLLSTMNDGSISSGDTSTAGISVTGGTSVNTMPSIAISNLSIYVAWQAPSGSNLVSNIFAKVYDASVPTETAAWKSMANSDISTGVSANDTAGAVSPVINARAAGSVSLVWAQLVNGTEDVFLKQY